MSQFPPCSLPGIVLAPSFAIFFMTSGSRGCPTYAPMGSGGNATGGIALAWAAISSPSRLFHVVSNSVEGAVPISPG